MPAQGVALFIHILAGFGLLFALGLEWTVLWRLRRSRTEGQVHDLGPILGLGRTIGLASLVAVVAVGIYLAFVAGWPA
jgi:hypothetical protein